MIVHRMWTLLLVALVGVLLAGCGSAASDTSRDSDNPGADVEPTAPGGGLDEEPLAARVNGDPITLEAFLRELERERAIRQAHGGAIPQDARQFEREVLDSMIGALLIEQAADHAGVSISQDELDAQVALSKAEAADAQSWSAWLEMSHLTEEEFRAQLRTQLLGSLMTAQIVAGVPETGEHVHARHILVDTEAAAQNVLNELQAGADFAELAQRYSLDGSTREVGGDLSWFARGQLLEPQVEAVAFSLQAGEISGIVASSLGYHIIQTLEHDPSRPVSPEVRQALIERAIEDWRQALWDQADIVRYVGEGS